MAERYAPAIDDVRHTYAASYDSDDQKRLEDEFDAALAAHDAQVLRDAAGIIGKRESTYGNTTCWVYPTIPSAVKALEAEAYRIAGGTSA